MKLYDVKTIMTNRYSIRKNRYENGNLKKNKNKEERRGEELYFYYSVLCIHLSYTETTNIYNFEQHIILFRKAFSCK